MRLVSLISPDCIYKLTWAFNAHAFEKERFLAPMLILCSDFMIQLIIVLNRESSHQITMNQLSKKVPEISVRLLRIAFNSYSKHVFFVL